MTRIGPAALLAWTFLLAGCGPTDKNRPPTVRFGAEACAHCRMIISDERFAAARVGLDGEILKFDDFGCLLEREANDVRPAAACWVHNFRGPQWLNARAAIFVAAPNVVSPMGHGLAAVPSVQEARELATDPASRTLRFSELPGFLAEARREPNDVK
jgi:copper chaperone NosL